jgi:hypothetical protein
MTFVRRILMTFREAVHLFTVQQASDTLCTANIGRCFVITKTHEVADADRSQWPRGLKH